VKSHKAPVIVILVKTGILKSQLLMDSRFRGSDGLGDFFRDHRFWLKNYKDLFEGWIWRLDFEQNICLGKL